MTTEDLRTFNPREIDKPFSARINLVPNQDGLIVNEDFIMTTYRRDSATFIQFFCSDRLWIISERQRQQGLVPRITQPGERTKSISFRITNQPDRRIIYVGSGYEIHCIYDSSQNTVFDIKAPQPINSTQVPRNQDTFRQIIEGFIRRRN